MGSISVYRNMAIPFQYEFSLNVANTRSFQAQFWPIMANLIGAFYSGFWPPGWQILSDVTTSYVLLGCVSGCKQCDSRGWETSGGGFRFYVLWTSNYIHYKVWDEITLSFTTLINICSVPTKLKGMALFVCALTCVILFSIMCIFRQTIHQIEFKLGA